MNRLAFVFAVLVLTASTSAQDEARKPSAGRSADAILADLNAAVMPTFNPAKQNDREAIQEFLKKRSEVMTERASLIKELFKTDPTNPRLGVLMTERWMTLANASMGQPTKELNDELDAVISGSHNEKLQLDALFMKAMFTGRSDKADAAAKLKAVEAFIEKAPKDPRGARLYYMAAQSGSAADQKAIFKTLIEKYPDDQFASMAKGSLKRLESVGKPFELEFTEAIKGSTISMKDLRGKVVVVDFWATWCGPCVAEMPKMKELYAKYRNKGVEFIGVSLDQSEDQGGLEKLKAFVAKNDIAWPQYYQGKGWESDFSRSWGINSIPCVFVVDTKGNLFSVEARGRLEEMIPELLEGNKAE